MQERKKHITFFIINLLLTCLLLSSGYAFADVIIDNGQAGTSYTGTWGISGGTLPYGTNSLWSRDGATYTWQFSSQPAGTYEVYMWWSGYATRATSIAVDIYHRDGQSTVTVNQQLNAGQWNSLGQYYFDTSGRVTIIAANGSTVSTCADAVRFAPVSTNSPPTAYIDSITPNPANPGQNVSFTGHGTDSDGTIAAYQWVSSINGLLSTESVFSSSTLSAGTHTISFRVQDNEGAWSAPVTQTLQVGTPPVEYIIDNGTAGTSFTGTWAVSSASNPYGPNSLWSRDGTTYTWTFTPAVSGNYDLSMWWTIWPSRSTAVPVDITFYGGTSRVVINQQLNGGKWNLLGNFSFLAGQSYTVRITSQPGPSSTCADAVKFSRVSDLNAPPVATIDSVTPNPALPGETVTFTGSGSDTDGTITGYSWRSSRDGIIGTAASFSTSALSEGIHTIYFKVRDNNGVWSPEVHLIIGHLGCSVPVRIMPLGDSITFGYGEIPSTDLITGYRQPLYQALINADHYVDFSGSVYAGQSVIPLFDFDHEGHGGWGAKRVRPPYGGGIAPYVQSFLSANPSDIVLLHIGTNDISDNAENPADVMEILSNIDLVSQDITVILARIISRNDGKALQTTQFNNAMEAAARARITNGDKIIIVNQESALNYSVDMWDTLHPNNAGYGKMANVWFAALHGILPVCPQASSSIISAIAGTGGTVSPAGAITVPSGNNQTFTIIPNSGYHISDVLVDNVSSGAVSTYTFENVTANHTIQAVFAPDAPPQEIIIDNRDASVSYTGTWAVSGASNPYAIDSVWSRDGTTFTWIFTPAVSGNYDLSMWWTIWPSRSTAVPVDITFYGGTSRVVINQQLNGGKWNLLGNFSFLAGQSYTVRITSQPGPSSTCADAVKFSRVSDLNAPPVATIDSVTPNPALPGETVTFTGSGSDTDGTITGYSWRSSRDGIIGTAASFSTSALSEGIHTIYFKVRDNNGVWSPEISNTLNIGNQVSNTEHIYFCLTFFGANDKALLIATLQDIGAVQQGNVWTYTNTALGKDYVIHIVEDIATMKQALYTENAHVIVKGHSNYGLGGVFIPDYAYEHQVLNNIRYIDDDLIFNYSSPWISVNVASCIISHAFPNWWPILQDGTNGIMPYDFGDPRGNPPYNYYLTYQIPGDPNIYKVETVRNSARERFPDSGVPAWYSPDGSSPNPSNPSQRQYYITNPDNSFLSAGRWLWTNDSYAGSLTGFYGFHYCRINAGSGSSQASWRFSIPVSGNYNVSAWWPASPLNTSQARYTVNHASGSTLVMQNQQVNGSAWNNLGTFSFNAGEYSVVLTDQSGSGQIIADAIRITNSVNPSIDITVDNSFCPKSHYYKKSIVFRRQLEIEPEKLKYKRMLYDACTTGSYYLEAFQRGTMFFTVIGSRTYGSYKYLKAYLEGKSDQEIWAILQAYDPVYDYYYFDKSPSEQ